jgi:hypothetical protein
MTTSPRGAQVVGRGSGGGVSRKTHVGGAVSVASDDVSWRCAGRRQGQRGRGLQAAVWLAGSTEAEAEESVLRRFRLGGVSSSTRRAAAGVALAWPTGGMAGR